MNRRVRVEYRKGVVAAGVMLLASIVASTASGGLVGSPGRPGEPGEPGRPRPDTCAATATRAAGRHMARSLGCAAQARRTGKPPSPRCLARSAARLTAALEQPFASCFRDVPTVVEAVDACVARALAAIPEVGRCSARKLAAARAAVAPIGRSLRKLAGEAPLAAGVQRSLCRRLERAGACPGTCGRVHEALAQCWETLPIVVPPSCDLPKPGRGDRVVVAGAHEGDGVSTATIVGQDDETTTARVVIEPGTEPLYVVLSGSESTIWRFEGETSRVSRVVLTGVRRQGVTGLAPTRVTDLSTTATTFGNANCFTPFSIAPSPEAEAARTAVEAGLRRPVDVLVGAYGIGTLTLPAGTVVESPRSDEVPPGMDPTAYEYALRSTPGGAVRIDPAMVLSSAPALAYEVLPHDFGIAQLIGADIVDVEDYTLVIARPMPRFPARLVYRSFLLAAGVPMPDGDPGSICVVSEETGLPVTRTGSCEPVPPADTSRCGLPPAAADARVLLIGVAGGDAISTATLVGQDRSTRTDRVVVEPGAEPLYVVLSGGYPTIWRFEGATERIAHAVLVGSTAQGITGIAPELVTDRSEQLRSILDLRCFASFWQPRSIAAVMARRFVERALDRPIDVFASLQSRGTITLPSATVAPTVPDPTAVPPGFDAFVFAHALADAPGGLVDVAPATVVSAASVERYEVVPESMGLAALVGAGDLELHDGSFVIRRPIPRFPADGWVRFVLPAGVPLPAGDPNSSCVVAEETGEPLTNPPFCSYPRLFPRGTRPGANPAP